MKFKFIGKTKLLRMLKMQMNNPDVWFKDVMYSREENFKSSKKEMIVFIDENDTYYKIRHEYYKFANKIVLDYEIVREDSFGDYQVVEQKDLLKERGTLNESCYG